MTRLLMKVSQDSPISKLAGAICANTKADKKVILSMIGDRAVAKGVNAVALACRLMESEGLAITITPSFTTEIMEDSGRRLKAMHYELTLIEVNY